MENGVCSLIEVYVRVELGRHCVHAGHGMSLQCANRPLCYDFSTHPQSY